MELGLILFERRHRGVRLTEAGKRFIAEVTAGICHLDLAIRTAGDISSGMEGRLALGIQGSIAFGFLADLRSNFRSNYPTIEQVVMEGRSSETIALVRDGKLDVAIVAGAIEAPDCHARELWREPFMIILPADHPLAPAPIITWADLASENFLVRHGGAGPQVFEHIIRRVAERERSARIDLLNVGRDTLIHLVAAGDGLSLTCEALTRVAFPGVVFRSIADEPESARFSAVWSPHNQNPALKNLLDLAAKMSQLARPS